MEGVFIVLEEFLGNRELNFRKPRVFFGRVAFPLDKVLLSGRSSFVMNDLFDFVMFLVICYSSFSSSFRFAILSYQMPTYLER